MVRPTCVADCAPARYTATRHRDATGPAGRVCFFWPIFCALSPIISPRQARRKQGDELLQICRVALTRAARNLCRRSAARPRKARRGGRQGRAQRGRALRQRTVLISLRGPQAARLDMRAGAAAALAFPGHSSVLSRQHQVRGRGGRRDEPTRWQVGTLASQHRLRGAITENLAPSLAQEGQSSVFGGQEHRAQPMLK